MKYLITAFVLVFCFNTVQSQTVNGVPIDSIDVEYMQIVGYGSTEKLTSSAVIIQIDFGRRSIPLGQKLSPSLIEEDEKVIVLNSMIDALNFFAGYEYEFVNAYTMVISTKNVYHYLLRKEKS